MFAGEFSPPVATVVGNRRPPTAGKVRETGFTAEVAEVRRGFVGRAPRPTREFLRDLLASARDIESRWRVMRSAFVSH